MTNRVHFIRHNGVEILVIDWSHASAEEIIETMAEARKVIGARPLKSVRTLTNVTEGRVDRKVTELLKEYVAANKPHVLAGAVVGLNDLKTVIFNFLNRVTGRTLRAMGTIDEAKNWLASVKV